MADSTEKQINTKPDSDKPQTSKKSLASGLLSMFIILIIAMLATGGFYLWQQQQYIIQNQINSNSLLQQQFQNLSSSITQLDNKLTTNIQIIDELKLQQTELSLLSQKALNISQRGQKEWILAEIDYLLRLANQRLQIAKDINSAIAALSAADQRIYELGDLNLFPVRKQLKIDIASLKALHQVDINGTAMAIDQMLIHLSSLPFKTVTDEIKNQLDNQTSAIPAKENTGFVDSVINTVMSIGEIKIHNRSIVPVTNAAQQQQLEQLLRSHLIAARLALLRYDQTLFIYDLKQAHDILEQHYQSADNRVSQIVKDILEILKLNLSPELPDINSSWNRMQDLIAKDNITQTKPNTAKKASPKNATPDNPIKMEAL